MSEFKELGLVDELVEACQAAGYTKPTEIQIQSIPHALKGHDIIALAETGSGKTAAFTLPILQKLLLNPQKLFALILAPTRELAYQIEENVTALGSGIGVKCVTIVGGMEMVPQQIALAKQPHIVIATPGRIVDHLENTKGFSLDKLQALVFDEADRLLNMDFEREIDVLMEILPKQRSTYLFSATMTSRVEKLQRASLRDPVRVSVSSHKYQTVKTLVQEYVFIPAKHKDCYLVHLLTEFQGSSTMVFCDTIRSTQRLTLILRSLGFNATPLHGQMPQPKRLGALNTFKAAQEGTVLVATDVASRGLDIPHVDLVVNYDVPTHSKDYIHRVGRTARAGRSGRALILVTQYDVELFQRIEALVGKKMELFPAQQEVVLALLERVSEAQRLATLTLREKEEKKKDKRHTLVGGKKRKR